MREERGKLPKARMKNGKRGAMKGRHFVDDIEKRRKMKGWHSITPSDGVADYCCLASAELLRNWSLMDSSFAG